MIPFQEAYDNFIKQKGNLFERSELPMDDADKQEVERLDRFSRKITYPVLLTLGCCAFIGSVYLVFTRDWIFAVGILLGSVACLAMSFYYKTHYGYLLQTEKKIVITGIVTKIVKSSGYYGTDSYGLTISEKETVFFTKAQVKGYKVGDIVRFEIVGKDEIISRKIEKIGNIRDSTTLF
jgi:hypothetical protein